MDYKTARPLIQSGDIIAFTHEGWSSWGDVQSQIIRIATRSEYSHVGIAWPVAGRVMTLEAVVPMIRIFPLSKLLPFYWISLNKPLAPEVEEFALSRVGESYSKWEAIKGFFGKTQDNEKWQCAEYVNSVLRTKGGVSRKDTPSALVFDAISNGSTITLVTK